VEETNGGHKDDSNSAFNVQNIIDTLEETADEDQMTPNKSQDKYAVYVDDNELSRVAWNTVHDLQELQYDGKNTLSLSLCLGKLL